MTNRDFFAINRILLDLIKGTNFQDHTNYSGSCLRDLWLRRDIKSIDLTVNLPLGAIVLSNFILGKCNCNKNSQNLIVNPKMGTAQFTLGEKYPELKNIVFNVSTSRKDRSYNENGLTPFFTSGTVSEDAHLKDFTFNAMYMYIQEELKYRDIVGMSFRDLRNKTVRTVVDPDSSFEEDPLRMLRAIRYSSELGFSIEKYTWIGICKNAKSITRVPDNRIRPELDKILVSEHADEGFRKLYYSGLLTHILPEIRELAGINQGKQHNEDVFNHSLSVMMKMKPTISYRLAGLFHDIGKSITKSIDFYGNPQFKKHETIGADLAKISLDLLEYPESVVENVVQAIRLHMRFKNINGTPSKHNVRRFMKESEKHDRELCLALINADNNSHSKNYCKPEQVGRIKKMINDLVGKEEERKIKLPVNGKDIMKNFGLKKGPRIGKAIDLLKEYSSISPKMSKDEALSIISDAIRKEQI